MKNKPKSRAEATDFELLYTAILSEWDKIDIKKLIGSNQGVIVNYVY